MTTPAPRAQRTGGKGGWRPKPFQRPSVDLTHHGRDWQHVFPGNLQPGDIVAGIGMIDARPLEAFGKMSLVNSLGETHIVDPDQQVYAFVEA